MDLKTGITVSGNKGEQQRSEGSCSSGVELNRLKATLEPTLNDIELTSGAVEYIESSTRGSCYIKIETIRLGCSASLDVSAAASRLIYSPGPQCKLGLNVSTIGSFVIVIKDKIYGRGNCVALAN